MSASVALSRRTGAVILAMAVIAATALAVVMGARPSAAAQINVMIEHYQFSPADLSVHVGDTVTWTNMDDAPHTVTTSSGPDKISSPTLNKGDTFSFTFTKTGVYAYYCAVHPDMKGSVNVEQGDSASGPTSDQAPPTTQAPPGGSPSSDHNAPHRHNGGSTGGDQDNSAPPPDD